jgi:hypothetical protein
MAARIMALVAKWHVFSACGVRLLLTGIRQVAAVYGGRDFRSRQRQGLPDVPEIGFANLAMGTPGICTIFSPAWLVPAAIAGGGLYYGLAALGHLLRGEQNFRETVAMLSDGFAFFVLLSVVVKG